MLSMHLPLSHTQACWPRCLNSLVSDGLPNFTTFPSQHLPRVLAPHGVALSKACDEQRTGEWQDSHWGESIDPSLHVASCGWPQ